MSTEKEHLGPSVFFNPIKYLRIPRVSLDHNPTARMRYFGCFVLVYLSEKRGRGAKPCELVRLFNQHYRTHLKGGNVNLELQRLMRAGRIRKAPGARYHYVFYR